ncbi:MAG: ComF family protein [Bacilli bacterium]
MTKLKSLFPQSKRKTIHCEICLSTFKSNLFTFIFAHSSKICPSCLTKMNPKFFKFKFENIQCLSIYEYDDFIKELLFQFKGCYDICLKDVFLINYRSYLNFLFSNYILICAPSSKEDDLDRGFNHVQEMFKVMKNKQINIIFKDIIKRQVDVSKEERKNIYKYLRIENGEMLTNKNVLIVDDVFTTGSTVKAMINLIKPYSPKKIKVLVMAKTPYKL